MNVDQEGPPLSAVSQSTDAWGSAPTSAGYDTSSVSGGYSTAPPSAGYESAGYGSVPPSAGYNTSAPEVSYTDYSTPDTPAERISAYSSTDYEVQAAAPAAPTGQPQGKI